MTPILNKCCCVQICPFQASVEAMKQDQGQVTYLLFPPLINILKKDFVLLVFL